MQSILVTGGAGYIGSHTCRQLVDAGYRVVVMDNLYSGHRWAVPGQAVFVEGDAGDGPLVGKILREHGIGSVIHFAGHVVVPESVEKPLKYYRNNVGASAVLLEACLGAGVSRFIFSSSAAVYGMPVSVPVAEDALLAPINPYGTSKLVTEWMLRDLGHGPGTSPAHAPFRYVALRYFNVAGAREDLTLGQASPDATHLIKAACETACGIRDRVALVGTDYPTPDGTCIRDYIHVEDQALAHLDALAYLERGDPPELVADAHRIRELLGWQPRREKLDLICDTAYRWERAYLARRNKS